MHFCSLSSLTYNTLAGPGFWPNGGWVRNLVIYLVVFGHILTQMCFKKKSLEKGAKLKKFNLISHRSAVVRGSTPGTHPPGSAGVMV